MRLMAPPRRPRTERWCFPRESLSTGLGRELSLRWHQALASCPLKATAVAQLAAPPGEPGAGCSRREEGGGGGA